MPQPNDLSRSLVALDQDSTIIAVVEMSQSSWLVAGVLPGIERQPRKKLEPSAERLLGLLLRWRDEAVRAGKKIRRIALAFEAGRDGFWLARWLRARGVEAHVIHASSVAVSREHRRAKTDRLDTELLKRGSWGGCAGNGATAPWRASRPLPKRTPSGPTGSASAWSGNARLKSPIENQGFFGLTVPPAGTPAKSGTLLLLSRSAAALLLRASNSGAAAASSLARFAFLV